MAKASARKALNKPVKLGDLPEWNLRDLYPALDSPEVRRDLELADSECAAFEQDFKGRLAVLAQWRARPALAFTVHRSAFVPPPKVMSAVVHIVPEEAPAGVSVETISALTAAAFGQRRKMLRQSLKTLTPDAEAFVTEAGLDPTLRAERLSIADFAALARSWAARAARD